MVLEILLLTCIFSFLFVSYLLFLALRRINVYENFIVQFQQIVEYAEQQMKNVDASGHYESDDETGFFFKQLKDLQNMLSEIFEVNEENISNAPKEKK
jgi:Asp-tRNA(Asn)/Glu-tRNA(Gln) amidotransferase C subunit